MFLTDWRTVYLASEGVHYPCMGGFKSVGMSAFSLQGSPEVQGSKFVIGAIIPGSNNKGTKEDVFVVVRATAPVLASVLQYPHASQIPHAHSAIGLHADLLALPTYQKWKEDKGRPGAEGWCEMVHILEGEISGHG